MPAASEVGFLEVERDQPQIVVAAEGGQGAADFEERGQGGTIVVGPWTVRDRIVEGPDHDEFTLASCLPRQIQDTIFVNNPFDEKRLASLRFTHGLEPLHDLQLHTSVTL